MDKVLVSNQKGKIYTIIISRYSDPICNCIGYRFRGSCSHVDRMIACIERLGDEE